jgi:hypothetical protein
VNKTLAISAVVGLVVSAVLGTSGSASAEPWPSGCDWGPSGLYTTYAKCTKGSGSYRAVAKCSSTRFAYGNWEPAGSYPGQSTASCTNVRPLSASINIRQS